MSSAVVAASGAHILATTQATVRRRGDPRHIRLRHEMGAVYSRPRFDLVPLVSLLTTPITYGTSTRLSEDPTGYPVLRMNNLTMDGWDITDLKYLDAEPPDSARVIQGDVLLNRTNGSISLVGKAAMFDLGGDWLYASYLLRLRLDARKVHPQFIVEFLNSPAGRLQIEMHARPILMVNVNPTEVGSLLIPLPSKAKQAELLKPLTSARKQRLMRDREASQGLSEMNDRLAGELGIAFNQGASQPAFAATTRTARIADRLGAQFFHPERASVLAAIRDAGVPHRPLVEAADFIRDVVTPRPGDSYVGLSAVTSHTGELTPVGDEAASAFRYDPGDILFGRLRPYLNKVHLTDHTGLCSTEFYVLRAKPGVLPAYLAVLLRSQLITAQTIHMMTGNTHPRVAPEDAKRISVPIPAMKVQRAIAADYAKRLADANRLRSAANKAWLAAQQHFDRELLG